MRWGARIIGGLLVVGGLVWLLQGIGLLLGSPMTGQSFWAIAGAVAMAAGAALLYLFGDIRRA